MTIGSVKVIDFMKENKLFMSGKTIDEFDENKKFIELVKLMRKDIHISNKHIKLPDKHFHGKSGFNN